MPKHTPVHMHKRERARLQQFRWWTLPAHPLP
eukprot:CAMPEP_0179144332 /NCGR_PEP_ID=MMETSP0796-20121207/69522_1 /TAXON_ID=73915 /ORGANISM="Pyrodinium bahamense, Strain pbaha01" /LENGTH=31 /DNA_ID= /DNA_START= /DNA_END= /DNA_ORIENTATION=